jgi:hypothetical protein
MSGTVVSKKILTFLKNKFTSDNSDDIKMEIMNLKYRNDEFKKAQENLVEQLRKLAIEPNHAKYECVKCGKDL